MKKHLVPCTVVFLAWPMLAWSQTAPAPPAPAPATNEAPASAVPADPSGLPPDLQQALQMPEGPDQAKAFVAAVRAWVEKDPVAAFTWMLTLPQPSFDKARMTTSAAAASANVKAAGDFLIQQKSDRPTMMLHGLMIGWAMKDPAAAEAWCTQIQTTRDFRYVCVFSVADGVCRKKGADAAAWATTLTAPDDRAAAIDGTATIWCRGNLAATTAWIQQLNPTDMHWAAKSVAASWGLAKVKTDPSLEVWVNQLPLSPADKEDVLKGPHFDSFHISKYQPPAASPNKT